MKIKEGFLLHAVAGKHVVVPVDADLDLNMMITLNDTGACLWTHLQEGNDEDGLVSALLAEYDVDEETARRSVKNFVKKLSDNGFLA